MSRRIASGRTKLDFVARDAVRSVRIQVGRDVRRQRLDAGLTLSAVAKAAGTDRTHLSRIEQALVSPSLEILTRISAALGGDLAVKLYPGTCPAIHDHIQGRMAEALLKLVHPAWARYLEVPVHRPVRGVIDAVFGSPGQRLLIATELESGLRRVEQTIRWSAEKAEGLALSDLARSVANPDDGLPAVSRLLVVRSTRVTREVATEFVTVLSTAYPARTADAYASLASPATPWPGPAVIWAVVEGRHAQILDRPPRGVKLGR
jgi:transcriptional regulator with XRE-family HTH domain